MAKTSHFKQNYTKSSYNFTENLEIQNTLIFEIRYCHRSALVAYIGEYLYYRALIRR